MCVRLSRWINTKNILLSVFSTLAFVLLICVHNEIQKHRRARASAHSDVLSAVNVWHKTKTKMNEIKYVEWEEAREKKKTKIEEEKW